MAKTTKPKAEKAVEEAKPAASLPQEHDFYLVTKAEEGPVGFTRYGAGIKFVGRVVDVHQDQVVLYVVIGNVVSNRIAVVHLDELTQKLEAVEAFKLANEFQTVA